MEKAVEARIYFGKILIDRFEELALELDPYDDNIDEVIKRATIVRLKMQMFYINSGKPEEMLPQIKHIESIINRLEKMQNKHVADM